MSGNLPSSSEKGTGVSGVHYNLSRPPFLSLTFTGPKRGEQERVGLSVGVVIVVDLGCFPICRSGYWTVSYLLEGHCLRNWTLSRLLQSFAVCWTGRSSIWRRVSSRRVLTTIGCADSGVWEFRTTSALSPLVYSCL